MKKHAAPLAVTLTLLLILPMGARAQNENMIENPGFETEIAPWIPRGAENCGPNHSIDTAEKHGGASAGRIEKNGYFYSKRFVAPEGAWLHARFWAKVNAPAGANTLFYFWKGKDPFAKAEGPLPTGNEWKEYDFYARVPAGTDEIMLALTFRGEGCVWYDDAVVTIDKTPPSEALVPNPGFENGMKPWRPRSVEGFLENHQIDTTVKHTGNASARIDKGGYYYSPAFVVPPGQRVTLTFWAKVADGTEGKCAFYLWTAKKPTRVEGVPLSGDEWKQYEISTIVPQGTDEVTTALEYFGGKQAWFDDVTVKIAQP